MQLVEGNAVKRFNGDMVIFPPPVYKSSDERLHFNYTIDKVMREIPVTIRKKLWRNGFFLPTVTYRRERTGADRFYHARIAHYPGNSEDLPIPVI
jgi:hypothetical protein